MNRKKPEHKYTQSERKKIYRIKKVKMPVKSDVPHDRKTRRNLIKTHYQENYGRYYCPALGGNVSINKDISCNKTFYEAAVREKSTKLALIVEQIIPLAVKLYSSKAKANEMQKGFSMVHVLVAGVRGVGYAKITVGEYADKTELNEFCQYSVSHLSIVQLKNKKK